MARDDALFYKNGEIYDALQNQKAKLEQEISSLGRDYILKVSEEDLCKSLVDKYTIEIPVLHDENLHALEPQDTEIDIRGRHDYAVFDNDEPHYVKGTSLTIAIPFEGEEQLFHFMPSAVTSYFPRGEIVDNEIHLTYKDVNMKAENVKKLYENDLGIIKQHLRAIASNVEQHNKSLEPKIRELITKRKDKILKEQDMAASLGIPIKRREDSATTYTIPTVRRKPSIEVPKVTEGAFKPEPALSMSEYEHILKIIQDMALVIERNPKAFSKMKEEDLRTHFLVPLNGHYEGQATGETFNFEGKTDILIRYEGRNVFIAECKFWKGEKQLTDTIDQLFKYTSWRDTKTAIILFNRNKEFTSVLSKISEIMKVHPCFKKDLGKQSETSFRYLFRQPSDTNREVILTIMAFDVPK